MAANLSRFEKVNVLVNSADLLDVKFKLNAIFSIDNQQGFGTITPIKFDQDTGTPFTSPEDVAKNTLVNGDPTYPASTSSNIVYALGSGQKGIPAMKPANIVLISTQKINDLWIRDTGAIGVKNAQGQISGVNFNFNGWGAMKIPTLDIHSGWEADQKKYVYRTKLYAFPGDSSSPTATFSTTATAPSGVVAWQDVDGDKDVAAFMCSTLGIPKIDSTICIEGGGAIEHNGRGLAIISESCVVNSNRNPNLSKLQIEAELDRVMGIKKVIWIPGVKAKEITDGHTDFYARFSKPSTILVSADGVPDSVNTLNKAAILNYIANVVSTWSAADKTTYLGSSSADLSVIDLVEPDMNTVQANLAARNSNRSMSSRPTFKESFAAGYVGFYQANNCIIMSQYGDLAADRAAFTAIRAAFPERTIIQLTVDGISNGGGTIHCATQQQIA